MLRFRYDGKDFALTFQHDTKNVVVFEKQGGGVKVKRIESYFPYTIVSIRCIEEGKKYADWQVYREAQVGCFAGDSQTPGDNYSKSTGRLMALRRITLMIPQPMRKPMWDCYMNRKLNQVKKTEAPHVAA